MDGYNRDRRMVVIFVKINHFIVGSGKVYGIRDLTLRFHCYRSMKIVYVTCSRPANVQQNVKCVIYH